MRGLRKRPAQAPFNPGRAELRQGRVMPKYTDLGPMWRDIDARLRLVGSHQRFPASAPGAKTGKIHTALVDQISISQPVGRPERLEVTLVNGPYSEKLFFDLEDDLPAGGFHPTEEEEAYEKQKRKMRKLKSIATILGLATESGLDLSEKKLKAAIGIAVRISVKDSGKTIPSKHGYEWPKLFVDVLGSAPALEPISEGPDRDSNPIDVDDDIPF